MKQIECQKKSWACLAPLLDTQQYIESIIAGIKVQAHPDFRICVTMNDNSSTFEVPEYIHSRLQPQIFIEFPEREEEFRILQFNVPFIKDQVINYTVDFLQKAHQKGKVYSVRDGINICRYYCKVEYYRKNNSLTTVPSPHKIPKKSKGKKTQETSSELKEGSETEPSEVKIDETLFQQSVHQILGKEAEDFLLDRNPASSDKHDFESLFENPDFKSPKSKNYQDDLDDLDFSKRPEKKGFPKRKSDSFEEEFDDDFLEDNEEPDHNEFEDEEEDEFKPFRSDDVINIFEDKDDSLNKKSTQKTPDELIRDFLAKKQKKSTKSPKNKPLEIKIQRGIMETSVLRYQNLMVIPTYHGNLDFVHEVRKAFYGQIPDLIAIELPDNLTNLVLKAANRLPKISMIAYYDEFLRETIIHTDRSLGFFN